MMLQVGTGHARPLSLACRGRFHNFLCLRPVLVSHLLVDFFYRALLGGFVPRQFASHPDQRASGYHQIQVTPEELDLMLAPRGGSGPSYSHQTGFFQMVTSVVMIPAARGPAPRGC